MTPAEFLTGLEKRSAHPNALFSRSMDSIFDYYLAPEAVMRSCGSTASGLLKEILHPNNDTHPPEGIMLRHLNQCVQFSARSLSRRPENMLFTYHFAFDAYLIRTDIESTFRSIDHEFLVVQYKNIDNTIRYRFFQSYISEYSLESSQDLSQAEFNQFIMGFCAFGEAKTWTEEIKSFYLRYFKVQIDNVKPTIYKRCEGGFMSSTPFCLITKYKSTLNASNETWDQYVSAYNDPSKHIFIPFDGHNESDPLTLLAIKTIKEDKGPKEPDHEFLNIFIEYELNDTSILEVDKRLKPLLESLKQFKNKTSTERMMVNAYKGVSLQGVHLSAQESHPLSLVGGERSFAPTRGSLTK